MKVTIASVAGRNRSEHFDSLVAEYVGRIGAYAPIDIRIDRSSEVFFESLNRKKSRTPSVLVLLDSRGQQLSSEEFARWLGRMRDDGQQRIIFAIGPADGWTESERQRASLLLSLGPMTLPHELARVVLSEQVYRAFTILAGHPYHSGH